MGKQEKDMELPWHSVTGKSAENYMKNELSEIFEPWKATYTGFMKHKFILDFFEKNVSVNTPVLDVGCGTGMVSRQLASAGYTAIVGIDPDKDAIDNARRLAKDLEIEFRRVKFEVGRGGGIMV